METVTMNYRERGKNKERQMTVAEWHQLLTGDKYQTKVDRLRTVVALRTGRYEGTPEGLADLPVVHVSERKDGGRKGATLEPVYTGMMVLTIPLGEQAPWASLRRTLASLPQTLLLFRGSSGRTLKVVCRATLPDSRLPADERDSRLFHQHAVAMAARFYEGQTGLRVRRGSSGGGRYCRMSYDRQAWHNTLAMPFVLEQPTEPLTISARRQMVAEPLQSVQRLPGYDEQLMGMTRFQFCLADVMAQQYREVDILLEELARRTMKNGLEAEFCLLRLKHLHPWCDYEVLARRIFRNVYGMSYQRPLILEQKEDSLPYHTLQVELLKQFMDTRYLLRRNIITDGVEYVERGRCSNDWQPLDRHVLSTMTMQALSEGIEAWDKDVQRYVDSTFVSEYDPVVEYLYDLPQWDGSDHIGRLAARVPTDNSHWPSDFAVWLRAMVAQWLHRNREHGNAMVPLLIGAQGDGKSTFCRLLLPEELQDYYTDRVDFANRNDTERMLTRFCLINIDEYDSLSARQNAFLKHVLQKVDVKSRKLYDTLVASRQRYAAFIGTTNDLTPLTDTTGSRRFLCIRTTGVIDTVSPVDHRQLYAQVMHQLRQGLPTYFSKSDEARIQQQNTAFQQFDTLAETFYDLFHLPQGGEATVHLSTTQLLLRMKQHNPNIRMDDSAVKRLSRMLVRKGFIRLHTRTQNEFIVAQNEDVKDT